MKLKVLKLVTTAFVVLVSQSQNGKNTKCNITSIRSQHKCTANCYM